jgi:uncharacterized protein
VKIAIVGSGISGNVVAYHLCREHDITVFEAAGHIGGHAHTHVVEQAGRKYAVDTGFIVFNDWTYPNFTKLLNELGVASQESSMSFSVRDEVSGLEYNGSSLNTLFAQRSNLLRPSFLGMVRDILRFNREAPELLSRPEEEITLGTFLDRGNYGRVFVDRYIVPMGAAIWSTDPGAMMDFPARFFIGFLHNHGMLSIDERPTWRVIQGGSARYVEKLTHPFRDRIRLNCPVEWIRRFPGSIMIKALAREPEWFDAVFLACHSDQALSLLWEPSPLESEVLSAIPYQENQAVLHTDSRMLPRKRLAWAAWNYHKSERTGQRVALTYNMNILQGLDAPESFLVTLNRDDEINPAKVIKRIVYHHPVFTPAGVAAQKRHAELNCKRNTYFCGAYWRNGFHEDGMASALEAVKHFRAEHASTGRLVHQRACISPS